MKRFTNRRCVRGRWFTLFLFVLTLSTNCFAQGAATSQDSIEVNFAIAIPKENSLNATQRKEIKSKIETMLARLQCAGAVKQTPFVIVPEVKISCTDATAGAKENYILLEGELVLVAKNRYDGTAYNEVTIPLRKLVSDKTSVSNPVSALIGEINPKDKRFVRFIRTTQQRIVEHYSGRAVEIP